MKPKFRRYFRKAIPGLIVIPAMTAMLSSVSQASIDDDAFGNVTLNDASKNGAKTIIADGGSSATPTVVFTGTGDNAVSLTGGSNTGSILAITGSKAYTVTLNSDTRLISTNHDGINTTASTGFTLNNSGIIRGNTPTPQTEVRQGVDVGATASATTVLNNLADAEITASNSYAIWFRGSAGVDTNNVSNSGLIESFAREVIPVVVPTPVPTEAAPVSPLLSVGIQGADELGVDNLGSSTGSTGGIIRGLDHGISAANKLVVDNGFGASITGTNGSGINAQNNAVITNEGGLGINQNLSGTPFGGIFGVNGISVGTDARIINATTFASTVAPVPSTPEPLREIIGGGLIKGSSTGISLGDNGYVENQNRGIIIGTDHGIFAGKASGTEINNKAGAQIIGGTQGSGITAGIDTDITNAGWIGQEIKPGISPRLSISLSGGVNVINLNTGSVLYGDVTSGRLMWDRLIAVPLGDKQLDSDTINMDGGWTDFNDWEDSVNAFTNSDFDDVKNGNLIVGDVFGIETLNKTSAGFGVIYGESVRIDAINVRAGELYINTDFGNSLEANNSNNGVLINVSAGAETGGTGTWEADVNLLGEDSAISAGFNPSKFGSLRSSALIPSPAGGPIVQPVPAPIIPSVGAIGTLNIVGDVTHSPGSFIRYDITPFGPRIPVVVVLPSETTAQPFEHGPTFVADLINHCGGVYQLGTGSTIRVAPTNNDFVIQDGLYTVVDSNSQILGNLPAVAVEFNEVINENDVGFSGTETPETGTDNTGAVIDRFLSSRFDITGTNLLVNVQHDFEGIGEGLGSNEAALGAALDASVSSPDRLIQDFIAALDYSNIFAVNDTLTSLVPSGVFGLTSGVINSNYRLHRLAQNHLAATRSGGMVEVTSETVDAKGHSVPVTSSAPAGGNGNVWGTLSYDWQDSDLVDGEVAAFTAGIDYRIAPNFLVGIMLDGSQADNDFLGGSSDVDSLRAAIYGTYGESTGLYADFLVGYGDHDISLDRTFAGIVGGAAGSGTDATSLQAMAVVGYAMESGCIKHGPFAGLEYQNVDVDGFTQTGNLPIGVAGYDVDSLRALIGYRAEASYGKFTPYASLAYAHEFEDGAQATTATLPGGATFAVTGGELDSAFLIGIGTDYSINADLSVNVGYRGEISTGDGLDSHGGSIGLNYSF